jgi:hypothetical protein
MSLDAPAAANSAAILSKYLRRVLLSINFSSFGSGTILLQRPALRQRLGYL